MMGEWLNRVHFGDCLQTLRSMPSGIVNTCVTSTPYYGLRDYGHPDQIGLEEEFIGKLVDVFREVRRVLRDDGTCWINIGDSYARSPSKAGSGPCTNKDFGAMYAAGRQARLKTEAERRAANAGAGTGRRALQIPGLRATTAGAKEKDLLGIPWMLAFALRAGFSECSRCGIERRSDLWPTYNGHRICMECAFDGCEVKVMPTEPGWYLRQEIIWSKPNPMPESVTDRCTKSHESILLLAKSQRYYFDADAIREPAVYTGSQKSRRDFAGKRAEQGPGISQAFRHVAEDRNKRSVWTVITKPYKGAHSAVYPPELITPCILAGAPPDGVVLDPFIGSGTTGEVSQRLGRQWIGCELNPDNNEQQAERTAGTLGLPL